MKTLKLKYYQDPHHGWIAFKIDLVEKLELLNQISSSSYQKGKTLYLEEDRDAPLVLKALETSGLFKVQLEPKHTDNKSPIRSYDRFLPNQPS